MPSLPVRPSPTGSSRLLCTSQGLDVVYLSLVMTTNRTRRIAKEIADLHHDTLSNISANPVGGGDDLTHLKGSFKGPPGTPYEGGTYTIDVRIPGEYPFRPPIMKFDTRVWHPNVSSQTVSLQSSRKMHKSLINVLRVPYALIPCHLPGHPSLLLNQPFSPFNHS